MIENGHPNYFFTQDSTRIFYNTNFDVGKINTEERILVFNYGLLCSNHHWIYQIPYFEQRGFKILLHDYRGHFNSSGIHNLDKINFDHIVEDLEQLLKHIGAKNVILFGHSMGVNVSLEYAKRFPQFVDGLVLISGTVFPPHDIMFDSNIIDLVAPYVEKFIETYPSLVSKFWSSGYKNPIIQHFIKQGGFNSKQVSIEYVQTYLKKMGELDHRLFIKLINQMRDHDIINHLEEISVPTLIVGGDKDKVIPNYLQNILHKYIIDSELYIVNGGSHVPQADFPDSINDRIYHFLKKFN
ncbi:MAG: alpha/beta hydrolase [Halobacteriovoraceae bacterium]|nr:alpha/beta hydrolase [Halobacteriovoraceae bacterium]